MAVGSDIQGNRNVIAVIGDGAMSAGMAFEGMNNAGASDLRLIVILNDNDMSIAQPVGAMSSYLSRLITSEPFIRSATRCEVVLLPAEIERTARRAREAARDRSAHQYSASLVSSSNRLTAMTCHIFCRSERP